MACAAGRDERMDPIGKLRLPGFPRRRAERFMITGYDRRNPAHSCANHPGSPQRHMDLRLSGPWRRPIPDLEGLGCPRSIGLKLPHICRLRESQRNVTFARSRALITLCRIIARLPRPGCLLPGAGLFTLGSDCPPRLATLEAESGRGEGSSPACGGRKLVATVGAVLHLTHGDGERTHLQLDSERKFRPDLKARSATPT